MFKKKLLALVVAASFAFTAAGCGTQQTGKEISAPLSGELAVQAAAKKSFTASDIPKWDKKHPSVTVHKNKPYFTKKQKKKNKSYESYGKLDSLGRCTKTIACIGKDLMPTEKRGEIGSIRPTGWHTVKYDGIDGRYLYNRCHLIGYQLTGENANERNLITGTRYMNVDGMLPYENEVADYLWCHQKNHVLYRVTPIFAGKDLLARGVLMEAYSVEDKGEGVSYCVFCYNVQPGITINYKNGESDGPAYTGGQKSKDNNSKTSKEDKGNTPKEDKKGQTYILNTNTKKFHLPSCSSVSTMSPKNKKTYTGKRKYLIREGYSPCGRCRP
ncbi:MAG: DNA/RNA non-specific endonuclease [Lachnospiraceae bacterium]|nr:DNA/RNA non-specific endonuclease [Lachnospiraceae bacterium]